MQMAVLFFAHANDGRFARTAVLLEARVEGILDVQSVFVQSID